MRTQLPRQALGLTACLSLAQVGRCKQRAVAPVPSAAAATAAPSAATGSSRPPTRHHGATLPLLGLLSLVFRMIVAALRVGLAAARPDPVRRVYGMRMRAGSQRQQGQERQQEEEREQRRQELGQGQGHKQHGQSQQRPAIGEGCGAMGPNSGSSSRGPNGDTDGCYPLAPFGPTTQAITEGADGRGGGDCADGANCAAPAVASPGTCAPYHTAADCDTCHASDDAHWAPTSPREPPCQQLNANQAVPPWSSHHACAAVAARHGPGQLGIPSVVQQEDGPVGPGPLVRLPSYEPFIQHRVHFSKIPAYELSQIAPGYEQRLALLVEALEGCQEGGGGGGGSGGSRVGGGGRRRLGAVYLRPGCIEVLLEEEEWGSGGGSGSGDSEDGVSIAERSAFSGSRRVATFSECGTETCPIPLIDEDGTAGAPTMVTAAAAEEGQEGPDGCQIPPLRSGCGYGTTAPSGLDFRRSGDSVGAERGAGLGSSGGGREGRPNAGAPGSGAVLFSGRLTGRSSSSLTATTRIQSTGWRRDDQHPGSRSAGTELDVAGIIGALLLQQSPQGGPTPADASTATQPGAMVTAQSASGSQRLPHPSPFPLMRRISDTAAAAAAAAAAASNAGAAMGGTEVPEPRRHGPSRRAKGAGRRGRTLTDEGFPASASAVSPPAALQALASQGAGQTRNSSGGSGGSARSLSGNRAVGDVFSGGLDAGDDDVLWGALSVQPRVLLLRPPQQLQCGALRNAEPSSPARPGIVAAAAGAGTGGEAASSSLATTAAAATSAAAATGGSSAALAVLRVTIPLCELPAEALSRRINGVEVLIRARGSYLRACATRQAVQAGAVAGGGGGGVVRRASDPGGGDVGQGHGGMGGDQQRRGRWLASPGRRVMVLLELELLELPSEPGLVMVDFRWRSRPCCVVPLLLTADRALAAELQIAVARWSRPPVELDELLLDLGTWEFHVAAVAAGAAPGAPATTTWTATSGAAAAATRPAAEAAADEAASDAAAAPPSQAAVGGVAALPGPSTRVAPSYPPQIAVTAGPAIVSLPALAPPPQRPPPQPPLLDSCAAEMLPALGRHLLCYAQACGWRRLEARLQSDLARLAAVMVPSEPQLGGVAAGAGCVAQHPGVGAGGAPAPPEAAAAGPQWRQPAASVAARLGPPLPVGVARRAVPRASEAGQGAVGKAPVEASGQGTSQVAALDADKHAGGTLVAATADGSVGDTASPDGGACVDGDDHDSSGGTCSGAGRTAAAAAAPAPAAAAAVVGSDGSPAGWSFLRRRGSPRQRPDWMQALLLVLVLRPVPGVEEAAFRQYADPWVLAQGLAIRWVEFVSLVATLYRCARDGLLLTSGPVMLFMAFGVGTLSLAARHMMPYNAWVRLERASRLPRYLGYMAAKVCVVVLRLPPPPGVAPYLMTPGMLVLEGLILPGSCLLPARTALLVIPLLNVITGFELLAVRATNSVATAVLVAVRTAVVGIATNLACHTYMRMCFDSRRRRAMGAGVGQGSMGGAPAKDSKGRLGGWGS